MALLLIDSLSIITLLILLASLALTIYSLVIFAYGISNYRRLVLDPPPNGANDDSDPPPVLPFISLLVAAKNEEKTLSRSLGAMVSLDYPKDRYEVIVVEDGSTDNTPELCAKFAREHPDTLKFFHREISKGKPSALNFALAKSRGDIIGVFDADSIPSSRCLRTVISSFSSGASALQGFTESDAKGGFLTRLLTHEHDAWFNAYMTGRKRLNLFVPFAGSCQFLRRDTLEKLGGWDENSLTEDMEISLRLEEAGIPIQYEPLLKGKEGIPSSLGALFGQRLRWFRGWLELIVPSIPRSFRRKKLTDALFLLLTPLIFAIFPALAIIGLAFSLMSLQIPVYWLQSLLYPVIMVSFLSLLLMAGVTIAYVDQVSWYRAILWIPVIFLYWGFLSLTAFISLLQALVRWPKKWRSTSKIQI
jgi:cellulose synthase/poly-beta-1,6-N-acetylglucosamine synthase-like glycosyltransferase